MENIETSLSCMPKALQVRVLHGIGERLPGANKHPYGDRDKLLMLLLLCEQLLETEELVP